MIAPTLSFIILAHPALPSEFQRDDEYTRKLNMMSRDLETVTSFYNLVNARGYADKLDNLEGRNHGDIQNRDFDDIQQSDILYVRLKSLAASHAM